MVVSKSNERNLIATPPQATPVSCPSSKPQREPSRIGTAPSDGGTDSPPCPPWRFGTGRAASVVSPEPPQPHVQPTEQHEAHTPAGHVEPPQGGPRAVGEVAQEQGEVLGTHINPPGR